MQVLDQQVAAARAVAEQRKDIVERLGIDLAALGVRRGLRLRGSAPLPRRGGFWTFIGFSKRPELNRSNLRDNPVLSIAR